MYPRHVVPVLTLLGPLWAAAAPPNAAAGAPPMRALVLFGPSTFAEEARHWREVHAAALEELASQGIFAQGFPVAVPTDMVPGLRPGYHAVIAGYCTGDRSRAALAFLRKRFPEVYELQVGMPPSTFSCPHAPAQRPAVAARAKAPRFTLAQAERLAVSEMAKDTARGERVEILDRASGRFMSLAVGKVQPSDSGHVILASRARTTRRGDERIRTDRPALLFIAARVGKPAVIARLDLPAAEGSDDPDSGTSTEMRLETRALSREAPAVALVTTRGNPADGDRQGSEHTVFFALSGDTFRELFSIPTHRSEIQILRQETLGLRDLQVTRVTRKLDGCGPDSWAGPCPPPDEDSEQGEAGQAAPDASGRPEPEKGSEEAPDPATSGPEIIRFCWDGNRYGDCPDAKE